MEKERKIGWMGATMMDSGKTETNQARALFMEVMEEYTQDHGKIISYMAKENSHGPTVRNTPVNTSKTSKQATVAFNGQMEKSTWVSGSIVFNTEKEFI